MTLHSLVVVSSGARWFVLVAAVIGSLVALRCLIETRRTVRANASDELGTPLNAVLGSSELLRKQLSKTATSRQLRYVANIDDEDARRRRWEGSCSW